MKQKSEYPDHVYKPGERMPRPKYSAPVSRAHQEKLFAYSFEDAWKRRSSEHSLYSPRGSRFPSAAGSIRRRSFRPEISSRRASVVQGMLGKNGEYDNDVENGV
jgi:hypothetical protein